MSVHSWDESLIGVDPASHTRAVLVLSGPDGLVDQPALDELSGWGWNITVAELDTGAFELERLARRCDVALFEEVRGTRPVRRALTASLPTVAIVPVRGHGRLAALLGEAGTDRDTTVLILRDPRDARILRKLSRAALVRAPAAASATDRAAALGAVLLRAYAWQPAPLQGRGSSATAAV